MDNIYEVFIAKSRYARYLDSEKRRENWGETVTRYFDFMSKHLETKHSYIMPTELRTELQSAVENFEVMPSMRALMSAGKALGRDSTAGFNCSYLPVDDPKSFDEAMFILMCGTGVGFSVERQYIIKLPDVPDQIFDSESTIVVSDSKEGWAKALRQVIAMLYSGEAPKWDVSKVRPAGARLKVFGGRASGPGPLVDLFKFVVGVFKNAKGRKLTSIECHDIMCKVGEVVVVGGVRRCLPVDTLVQVAPDEWVRIDSLSANDTIYMDGQDVVVNNVFDQGEQEVVKIELEDGTFLESTPTHKWLVFNRDTNEREWVMTRDLTDIHGMIDE